MGDFALQVVRSLTARGLTVAVAESVTGGAVASDLVSVPGASGCLRGGVVAYATETKHTVLGVPAAVLAAHGAVHPQVALAMARRVRAMFGADIGLATTGVAGPEPQDGRPVGEVHVAVVDAHGEQVVSLSVDPGRGRDGVRAAAGGAALELVLRRVATADAGPGG